MIKVKPISFFQRSLKGVLSRILEFIENNNNADFYSNGESDFVESVFQSYKNQAINIFDVGGNNGSYVSIIIKNAAKYSVNYKIHVFEPVKASYAILKEKYGSNPNVILNNFGLSDNNGEQVIYLNKEGSSLASLYPRDLQQYNISMDMKEVVVLKKLADYVDETKIDKIHFLKIDIEGHELSAFNGFGKYLSPEFIPLIQFEYGGANIDSKVFLKDLYKVLEAKGYCLCKIKKGFLEKRKYNAKMENFQYANYVALNNSLI
jgi:FkbM family methyltransferase